VENEPSAQNLSNFKTQIPTETGILAYQKYHVGIQDHDIFVSFAYMGLKDVFECFHFM
jgi:hypothetical protein